jgi:hypothetical protein
MKNISLSEDVQKKVQNFLTVKHSEIENQKDLDNLLCVLSPSLRLLITQHVFLNSISKMSVFSEHRDIVDFIVMNIETLTFMPDEYIIKQG